MKHLYYVLTSRCNERCRICPRGSEERIRDEDINEILSRLENVIVKNKITDITLSGGEPSLFRGLPEVLELLSGLGVSTVILSNALRFADQPFCNHIFERIHDKERFTLVTAIHSLHPEIHDHLTGVPGSHDKTVQGLCHVAAGGIRTEVKCVIGRHNLSELPDYPAWVKYHISMKTGLLFCGMDYAGMEADSIQEYKVNFREVKPYLEQALEWVARSESGQNVRTGELPLCALDPYYWDRFYQSPRMNGVYADSHWETEKASKPDIWPMASACKSCKVSQWCSGIWSAYESEYGEGGVKSYI